MDFLKVKSKWTHLSIKDILLIDKSNIWLLLESDSNMKTKFLFSVCNSQFSQLEKVKGEMIGK